jgi:hypothetical protein
MDVASPSYLLYFTRYAKQNGHSYIGIYNASTLHIDNWLEITKLLHLTLKPLK